MEEALSPHANNMAKSALFPTLVEPQDYGCQIWAYDPSLSRLYLRIHKGDFQTGEILYLVFGSTHYFDGPLGWESANFQLAPAAEVAKLVNQINPIPVELVSEIDPTLGFNLYKVATPIGTVRILAASCFKADLGPNFKMAYPKDTPL